MKTTDHLMIGEHRLTYREQHSGDAMMSLSKNGMVQAATDASLADWQEARVRLVDWYGTLDGQEFIATAGFVSYIIHGR